MFNHSGFRYLNHAQTRWTYVAREPRMFYLIVSYAMFGAWGARADYPPVLRVVEEFRERRYPSFTRTRACFRYKGYRLKMSFQSGETYNGLPVIRIDEERFN